jgi:ubiquinone/menaquinone biosynthesis C-methylase UbiE
MIEEIIKNYKNNKRCVYNEPSINIYDEQYYKAQCGGFETFNCSKGRELDDVRAYVLKLCSLKPSYTALDIGCGRGELLFALANQELNHIVGIDLSQDSINLSSQTCQQQIHNRQVMVKKMSATQLEFDDDIFDIAFMTDLVEHLSEANLKQSIAEAYRVLKPGGHLVIHTLPTVNFKLYGQYIAKLYFRKKGVDWATPTSKEEISFGHINIQSRSSLKSYIYQSFSPKKTKVFYAPVNSGSFLKKLITLLGFWTIMSPHLWAIARK